MEAAIPDVQTLTGVEVYTEALPCHHPNKICSFLSHVSRRSVSPWGYDGDDEADVVRVASGGHLQSTPSRP